MAASRSLIPGVSSGPDAINVGKRKVPIALVAAVAAILGVVLLARRSRSGASASSTPYDARQSEILGLQDSINQLRQQYAGLQGGLTPAPVPASAPGPVTPAPPPVPVASKPAPTSGTDMARPVVPVPPDMFSRPGRHPVPWSRDSAPAPQPIRLSVASPFSAPSYQPLPGQRQPQPIYPAANPTREPVRRPGRPY